GVASGAIVGYARSSMFPARDGPRTTVRGLTVRTANALRRKLPARPASGLSPCALGFAAASRPYGSAVIFTATMPLVSAAARPRATIKYARGCMRRSELEVEELGDAGHAGQRCDQEQRGGDRPASIEAPRQHGLAQRRCVLDDIRLR